MNIQQVKKGDRIEAAKINEIITAANERYNSFGLVEGSQSFSMVQGGTNTFRDFPNMWTCKFHDEENRLKIRGGMVIILDVRQPKYLENESSEKSKDDKAEKPYRSEIEVQEEFVEEFGDVWVEIDIQNERGRITQEKSDASLEYVKIGTVKDNGHGFKIYKQLNRAEIYIGRTKGISFIAGDGIWLDEEEVDDNKLRVVKITNYVSFIGGDGIKIEEEVDEDSKRKTVTISSNLSFIGKDGVVVDNYTITDVDGSKKSIVEIGLSPVPNDFSFIEKDEILINQYPDANDPNIINVEIGNVMHSFIAGDGIEIEDKRDNNTRFITISNNVSFIGGDGIQILESIDTTTKQKTVEVKHLVSFIAKDGITINESVDNGRIIIQLGVSNIANDYSFIADDDILLDVYPDPVEPSITTVKIGNKKISFVEGDNIQISESNDSEYRYVTISSNVTPIEPDYISFVQGDNIQIDESQIPGGRQVKISASVPSPAPQDNISFCEGDNIDINETTSNGVRYVTISSVTISKITADGIILYDSYGQFYGYKKFNELEDGRSYRIGRINYTQDAFCLSFPTSTVLTYHNINGESFIGISNIVAYDLDGDLNRAEEYLDSVEDSYELGGVQPSLN